MTTHSDYIIKEMNILITLNHDRPHLKQIMRSKGYKTEELLSAKQLRVYIAEEAPILLDGHWKQTRCPTLIAADINSELGIEARSFDTAIDDMNQIQEAIFFGEEDQGWMATWMRQK